MESDPEEKKPLDIGVGHLNHNAKAEIGKSKLKEKKSAQEIVKYGKPGPEYEMEPKLEEKKLPEETIFSTNKEKAGKTDEFKMVG